MAVFDLKTTVPKELLSERKFNGKLLRELQIFGDKVQKAFDSTTQTWEEHSVDFTPDIKFARGDVSVVIQPSDSDGESLRIWMYLNDGTTERWAVLSDDWVSKTWPGRIESRGGEGSVLMRGKWWMGSEGYGKGYAYAHQIEGRDWINLITSDYEDDFFAAVSDAIDYVI